MVVSEELSTKSHRAGRIAKEVRETMKKKIRAGIPIVDLCEQTESMIRKKGGTPAFPCNISIDEVAAHYTSPPQDHNVVPENSVVKIDVGVHVDGYIADTATTVCLNPEYDDLVRVAENALKKAVEILRPGLSLSRFGSTIQKTIKNQGFKPISNLTGHLIGRYVIHAGKSLPNVFNISASKVKEGEIYGVEPFVTVSEAAGKVESGKTAYIFRVSKHKSLKHSYAKQLLKYIDKNFKTLPFAERWLQGYVPKEKYKSAFSTLTSSKCLVSYPVLVEASGHPVAQAEHTVLIKRDGCVVLT